MGRSRELAELPGVVKVDESGNVIVGGEGQSYSSKMAVHGGIETHAVQFNINRGAGGAFEWVLRQGTGMQFYVNNASVAASLTSSGVWTNASDARYKENVEPIEYGLAHVLQMQPRKYNVIGSDKKEVGFIAQEVLPLVPELVDLSVNSVTEEERFTLSYGQMTAVLVKAIQDLNAKVEAQAAEIVSLKGA